MKNARTLHDEAMTQLREAKAKRELKDYTSYESLLTEAFHLESEAAHLLKDKVEAEPTRSVLFRSAATLALECKKFDQAEQLVMTALASGEKVPPALRKELSKVFEAAGKPQNFAAPTDARRHYERALAIQPNSADLNAQLAAVLEERFNDYVGARFYYIRALELEAGNAGLYNNLAVLLAKRLNCFEEARALYERAIELDPNYADTHYNLAILLGGHFKDYTGARTHFERAIKLNANHAKAHYNLAVTLIKLKDYTAAQYLYRQACALNPSLRSSKLDIYFRRNRREALQSGRSRYSPGLLKTKKSFSRKRFHVLKVVDTTFPITTQSSSISFIKENRYISMAS